MRFFRIGPSIEEPFTLSIDNLGGTDFQLIKAARSNTEKVKISHGIVVCGYWQGLRARIKRRHCKMSQYRKRNTYT